MKKLSTNFANKIRQERKALGLNQTELAEMAGTGINFVSQLEMGKESIRLDKLLAILKVLGLEMQLQRGKRGLVIKDTSQSKSQ